MKIMSTAEKAALFDRMVGMGVIDTTKLLSDFSTTLAGVLETELEELDEPVFTNPTTGKEASSVHAILLALDYGHIPNWPALVRYLKKNGGDAVFMRRDLPKSNPAFPTVCLDLDKVEDVLGKYQPRKGPKVIKAFKKDHDIK